MTGRLVTLLIAAATALVPAAATAQDWPTRPIHVIVGFGPGSGADITARVVGARMTQILGQQIVVENKAGAGSSLAAEAAAGSGTLDLVELDVYSLAPAAADVAVLDEAALAPDIVALAPAAVQVGRIDGPAASAPFTTSATGVATGLNADKVDGKDAATISADANRFATVSGAGALGNQRGATAATRTGAIFLASATTAETRRGTSPFHHNATPPGSMTIPA